MKLLELLEALNTILPHKLIEDTQSRKQYGIKCEDTLFMLVFDFLSPDHAIVSFYEQTEQNTTEFGITNKFKYTGPLFSTIINIIKEEFNHLDMIAYTTSGKSRKSLYGMLAKKYSSSCAIYNIPTSTVEVTIISKYKLSTNEKQQILLTAEQILNDK